MHHISSYLIIISYWPLYHILVDRTKSMVKLTIFVVSFVVKDELLNINASIREKSLLPKSLWPVLLNCLGICNSHYYMRNSGKKWITGSLSLPQLHIALTESWKLCFNLCSHKWLKETPMLLIHLIPIGL